MEMVVALVLDAGKSAVETAAFVLLPIVLVATILLRLMERFGLLGILCRLSDPVIRPFGLTGMGVIALIQTGLIGFAAPIPILAMLEKQGESQRRIAALFAAVLTISPGNGLFPLAVLGVDVERILFTSFGASVVSATMAFWVFGRHLESSNAAVAQEQRADHQGLLHIINDSGAATIRLIGGIVPMLIFSLTLVLALERSGAVDALARIAKPILNTLGIDRSLIVPIVTKCLAGGTALVGAANEMVRAGALSPNVLNNAAAFLVQPLDLPGLAIFASAVPTLGKVMMPVVTSAMIGILVRALIAHWI